MHSRDRKVSSCRMRIRNISLSAKTTTTQRNLNSTHKYPIARLLGCSVCFASRKATTRSWNKCRWIRVTHQRNTSCTTSLLHGIQQRQTRTHTVTMAIVPVSTSADATKHGHRPTQTA